MEHDPVLSSLTAPYICSVIADLKANYHPFYTLLIHAPQRVVSINAPLCSFCVPYFLYRAQTFHENDCFTVGFDSGFVVGTEDHFTADIVVFFYTELLRRECRRSLMAQRVLTPSEQYAELCRLSQAEYLEVKAIFTQLNEEIVKELQIENDQR